MTRYYFLGASLPTIKLGEKPEILYENLRAMLDLNLTEEDQEKMHAIQEYIDIRNIKALWLEEPIDPRGNLSEKELDEALLVQTTLPDYVFEFLQRYESMEDRLNHFSSLYTLFFENALSVHTGFLYSYFKFEREYRLVLAALRAKKIKRDITKELQYEDPTDPFVPHILAQKDMEGYEPPKEYERVKFLFQENIENPKKLNRALLEYRFQTLEDMEFAFHFSIEQILGYLVRLMIVESYYELDEEQGQSIVEMLS